MTEEIKDVLNGSKGIDTLYERNKIDYRPSLVFSKKDIHSILRPETLQSIERSRAFTITQNLSEYDELIEDIDNLLKTLRERNKETTISQLQDLLDKKDFKNAIVFEREHSDYRSTADIELYSLLYNMKNSCVTRRDFLDAKFRSQFTSELDIEKIKEHEEISIQEWEQLEADVMQSYKTVKVHNHEDEDFSILDSSLEASPAELNFEILKQLEDLKRNKELLHVSLADTSYIHRNRYFFFLEVVEKARILIHHPESVIDRNLIDFCISIGSLSEKASAKSHLLLNFRSVKEKHDALKGRIMTIEDQKEEFASEKQFLYQQLEVKTIEPLKSWMYEQEEGVSEALDVFSQMMIGSMETTRKQYEDTLADMLNFYRSEANFYSDQINFIKNKEEIRRFYRIIEDLEEVGDIRRDWVEEYLRASGYSV